MINFAALYLEEIIMSMRKLKITELNRISTEEFKDRGHRGIPLLSANIAFRRRSQLFFRECSQQQKWSYWKQ